MYIFYPVKSILGKLISSFKVYNFLTVIKYENVY